MTPTTTERTMRRLLGHLSLITLLVAGFVGCGTLLNSNPQKVVITSGPDGAAVAIDGEKKGVTPLEVLLPTDQSYEVVVTAPGYEPEARVIERSLSVAYTPSIPPTAPATAPATASVNRLSASERSSP